MPCPFLSLRRDPQNPRRGRIAERTLNLGGEAEIRRYAYDSAGRLARVTDGSGGLLESYQYDHEGRRLADINPQRFLGERRYSYNLGDRLGQVGAVQYGHDKSGFRNLKIEGTSSGQRETNYQYEPSGLLLRVDLPDGRRIDYAYDAKGQRTQKHVNGRVVEAYQWLDPLRLSEFHDGQRWWRLAYLKGRTPVGVTNGGDSYLLFCDQVGTPLALATTDGHVVQTMQYDSFGNLLQVRGDAVRLPIGFAGGLFDADTGLTRFPWRDYDADTGRFTALDPMGAKGGDKDWYGYCVADPVNRVDVWGLEDEDAGAKGKRIVAEGAKGAATGAIVGGMAGSPSGVGALPGALVGGLIGAPLGLLRGVRNEILRVYWPKDNDQTGDSQQGEPVQDRKTLEDWWRTR